MEEKEFLNLGGAVVTSTKVVIAGKTFATRNIGSVAVQEIPASTLGVVLLGMFGLVMFAAHWLLAVAIIGLAIWLGTRLKPTLKLVIMAGGGEVVALESKDSDVIRWAAAGSVDTDLSFLSFLKVYRTDVTHR